MHFEYLPTKGPYTIKSVGWVLLYLGTKKLGPMRHDNEDLV